MLWAWTRELYSSVVVGNDSEFHLDGLRIKVDKMTGNDDGE